LDMEGGVHSDDSQSESEVEEEYLAGLTATLEDPEEQEIESLPKRHYFVPGAAPEEDEGWGEEIGFNDNNDNPDSIDRFLVLPQADLPEHAPLPANGEPQIDYSRSHILTSDEFVASLEAKAAQKQAILEEAHSRRRTIEETKEMHRLEKLQREKRCRERAEERAANKREKECWKKIRHDGWGDKLHELIKLNTNHPGMHVRTPYNLAVPQVCRYNQRIAMLKAKFKKEGKDPRLVAPAMAVEPFMRAVEGLQPLHQSPSSCLCHSLQERLYVHADQVQAGHCGTYPTLCRSYLKFSQLRLPKRPMPNHGSPPQCPGPTRPRLPGKGEAKAEARPRLPDPTPPAKGGGTG
jgi:hypothetical protein